MDKYYLTFGWGQKAKINGHLCEPKNGWVEVTADSYEEAESKVRARFGMVWAVLYAADNFTEKDKRHYPDGCLEVI